MSSFRALGIIPARGGSKTVPRKNLVSLGGKPLIAWSIERGRESILLDRLIVSTDDDEIAGAALALGADVPFRRPSEFAADDTPDLPVFRHALEWLARHDAYVPDAVVHLRPTLPFRTARQIDEVIALLSENDVDCVKSVYVVDKHPHKMWRLADNRLEPYLDTPFRKAVGPDFPRQKLEPVYWSAGLVDGIRTATIADLHSTTGERVLPYFVDADACVDLDTPHDFRVAEAVLTIARQEGLEWAS
jgi:CMP-N,N'-diacetyllegionaminic acid synthase